jgi:hypothetical protein
MEGQYAKSDRKINIFSSNSAAPANASPPWRFEPRADNFGGARLRQSKRKRLDNPK